MGFLWEGSTGARAVQLLRELPQGIVVDTIDLAERLAVKPGALHQLLANAVNLRLIKKVHIRGHHCVGWKLGPGNDSVTIERRKPQEPPSEAELARRRAASDRRRRRASEKAAAPAPAAPTAWGIGWPPGTAAAAPPAQPEDELEGTVDVAALPVWLRGLIASPAPAPVAAPAAPAPEQLQLFDPAEVGPGGRARWRRLDLMLPEPLQRRLREVGGWRQTTFAELEAFKSQPT